MRSTWIAGLLLVASVAAGLPAQADDGAQRWVWGGFEAPTGTDEGNDCLDRQTSCETIGHALDVADDGDTVTVLGDWTYPESLTITQDDLTLEGAEGVVHVQPDDLDRPAIRVVGDDVTIDHLVVSDQTEETQPADPHTLVRVEGDRAHLDHLDLSARCLVPGDVGVHVHDPEGPAPDRTRLEGLVVDGGCTGIDVAPGATDTRLLDPVVRETATAISLRAATDTLVLDGFLHSNEKAVHVTGDAEVGETTLVRANNIVDNGLGLDNDADAAVDARFNWWGNRLGTLHPTEGEGRVEGQVATVPGCLEEGCPYLEPVAFTPTPPHPMVR